MLAPLTSLRIQKKRLKTKAWKEQNPRRIWAATAYKSAKARARKKGVPFNLTIEYVMSIMPDRCPVFDTEFKFCGNKVSSDVSPSLDRIVPAMGYVEGNVKVISMKANNIKNKYCSEDIFIVAKWLQGIEKDEAWQTT